MRSWKSRHPRLSSLCTLAVSIVAALPLAVAFACAPRATPPPPTPTTTPEARPATTPAPSAILDVAHAAEVVPPMRLARLVERNLAPQVALPETLLAARMNAWRAQPVGERISRWAQLFAARSDNAYTFGPKVGGYVGESLLVQDYRFDCVLLFYRCTELARTATPRDAIVYALGTRFSSGDPLKVVGANGSVDYTDASHLDYSEDFAATGLWGVDVTRDVGDAAPDTAGTTRYAASTRWYIPTEKIRLDRLQDGDLLFFVLNERHEGARKLREQYGLLIGHQGIVHRAGTEVRVIHAAQSDLSGVYTGNRVVDVDLKTYLRRVERWKGIMVSRIEDAATGPGSR